MGSSDSNDVITPSSDGLNHPPVIANSGKFMDMVRSGSNKSLRPKSPEKSKTLMRSVVNKPGSEYKHKLVGQSVINPSTAVPPRTVATHASIDADRQARSVHNNKNQLVSRFSPGVASISETKPQSVTKPTTTPVVTNTPVAKPTAVNTIAPHSPKQPSMDIIEKSIARAAEQLPDHVVATAATGREAKKRSFGRRLTTVMAGSLAVLLIGGFFVYQNFNKLDLYIASSKAGFQATTPSYDPSGYDLSKISSSSGIIQTSYHSNSDARRYTISEKSSNWDNNTLLDSYVYNVAGQNYETVAADGRTIYLYGSGNATWVNNGIWYVVTSNNALSDQQLIQLATSM